MEQKIVEKLTKQCTSEAVVFQVLVHEKQLVALDATTVQLYKMRVLQSRNHAYFIYELSIPLLRLGRKLLHSYDRTV